MRKSIAAIITAMAMVIALVLPMTAFADDGAPANKSAKTYDEKFDASKDEPEYDVVVEDYDDEEEIVVEDADEEDVDEDVTLVVDVEDDDVDTAEANDLSAKVKAIDVDLPDGEYDIDYDLSKGAWNLAVPAKLFVKDGKAFSRLTFNNPDLEKINLNGKEILPTKWINVDGFKGKLPVFDLPVLALGAATGFSLYSKNGDVEKYTLNVKDYDANIAAPAVDAELPEAGEKVLNYYDCNNGAHHVIVPSETKAGQESSVKIPAIIAGIVAEALVAGGLFLSMRKKKND